MYENRLRFDSTGITAVNNINFFFRVSSTGNYLLVISRDHPPGFKVMWASANENFKFGINPKSVAFFLKILYP